MRLSAGTAYSMREGTTAADEEHPPMAQGASPWRLVRETVNAARADLAEVLVLVKINSGYVYGGVVHIDRRPGNGGVM